MKADATKELLDAIDDLVDPTANLNQQRALVTEIRNARRDCNEALVIDLAGDLASLVEALDNWIVDGGFLPGSWRNV